MAISPRRRKKQLKRLFGPTEGAITLSFPKGVKFSFRSEKHLKRFCRSYSNAEIMQCDQCERAKTNPAWPGYSADCPACEKRAKESMNE